jgi:hypothetical protein
VKRWEWMGWSGIAAMAVVLAVAAWVAWEPAPKEPPRAREFRDYDVCLLTDAHGIAIEPAKTVWQGLQTVLDRTSVRVTYAQVTGEQTAARAQQFLASQVQQRCGIIVAVGDAPTAAVAADKDRYPQIRFVPLTGSETAEDVTAKVLPLVPAQGK